MQNRIAAHTSPHRGEANARTYSLLILGAILGLLASLLLFGSLPPTRAQANGDIPLHTQNQTADAPQASFTVTNTNDSGVGSLRQAILNANVSPGADTINFSVSGVITLTNTLVVTDSVTIDGTGQVITISGNSLVRVISSTVALNLNALTIANGNCSGCFGGGVASLGNLMLTNVTLYNNQGTDGGGAFAANGLALTNVQLISNTASSFGGGAYAGGTVNVNNSVFQRNIGPNGGGLYTPSTAGSVTLTGTQFISNSAQLWGGGIYANNAANITNGLFQHNTALGQGGGGMRAQNNLAMTNTLFIDNSANNGGGGIYQAGNGTGQVINSLFARNNVTNSLGAGLYLNSTGGLKVLNSTIPAQDLSNSASAIYVAQGTVGITDTITYFYAIGISNTGGTVYENFNVLFNPIHTGGAVSGGSNDLYSDPKLVDIAADNYHLQAGSPAIDHGANTGVATDIDGQARPFNGIYDIGYDEYVLLKLFLPIIVR